MTAVTATTTERKIKKRSSGGGALSRKTNFTSYIHRILKQQITSSSEGMRISREGMLVTNGIVVDLLDRLIASSMKFAMYDEKTTLKTKHVWAATTTLLTGQLGEFAVAEGARAVETSLRATAGA